MSDREEPTAGNGNKNGNGSGNGDAGRNPEAAAGTGEPEGRTAGHGERAAVVAGPDDDGIGDALAAEGVAVRRVDGAVTSEALRAADIGEAGLFVLTTVAEATAIPLVKELAPDARVVVYSREALPEFVAGQTDLAVDPDLLEPAVVAEELG